MVIMLIEDDLVDAKTVKRVFDSQHLSHELRIVNGGAAALAQLGAEGAALQGGDRARPGLILLDLNMSGMNGLEVLAAIKNHPDLSSIPVIVLSTSDLESDIRASYQGGVSGYFVKPLEYTQFAQTLQCILRYWELCQHPQRQAVSLH